MSAAERTLVRFEASFLSHGLLTHSMNSGDHWVQSLMGMSGPQDFRLQRDCGEHCSAFTLLHPKLPLSIFANGMGYNNGVGLAFHANEEVWSSVVQCMSVVDSNSANRACCACYERQFCPMPSLGQHDSGYCAAACSSSSGEADARCKQLAAGCGVNTISARFDRFPGQVACTEQEIRGGHCRLCERPQWCIDPGSAGFANGGHIDTPEQWLDTFYRVRDKRWIGSKQCKYKPDQREAWIETAHEYNRQRQAHADQKPEGLENEVNLYVGPGDGGVEALLARSLAGLLFFRSTGQEGRDLPVLRQLRSHLSRVLGWQVPIFAVTNEPRGRLRHWDHSRPLNLRAPPYHLQLVET